MKNKFIFIFLFILIFSIVYYIFFYNVNEENYQTQKVKRADISESIEAIGKVYAREQVDVGAQVSGQILKIFVKEGDKVEEGDLIAQIDKDKQQNDFDIIKAKLESVKASLQSKEVALSIANKQYIREQKLFQNKATSLESLESIKNKFYSLKAEVAALKAEIIQLEISLKNSKKDLEYTTIRSPISGYIINIAVDEGQTVNANQNTPTIAIIANLDEMEVRMEIAEADVGKIKASEVVNFSLLSNPEVKYKAKIASIDLADTKNSSSNSSSSNDAIYYYAKFFVKNKNNFLRIGMSVENEIIIKTIKNALIIPTYAIKNDNDGYYVNVLNDKKVEKKYIKLGIKDSLNTEILSGLSLNDEIVLFSNSKKQ